ncbi:MAG: hypothetical protein WA437_00970 [Candidatus Sulfotelmatobacter sp.]
MKKCALWFLLVTLLSAVAFTQDKDKDVLPNNFLSGMHVIASHPAPGGPYAAQKRATNVLRPLPTATGCSGFPPCVDTLINFTGQFRAEGVYLDGTARDVWQYSMVGRAPSHNGTTVFNAPVIPVTIDMLNADGTPRSVVTNSTNCPKCTASQLGKTVRLISTPTAFVTKFLNGPVYGVSTYTSSPVPTQIADAEQRAEFASTAQPNWHTLLAPNLTPGLTMALIEGTYFFSLNDNGSCCAFVLVSDVVFEDELFPPTAPPDNSTVIGAAEVGGLITTKDISTFFFPNVYLYSNDNPNDCCILGFHTFDEEPGDASNGDRLRFYVMNYSSWITPGLFSGNVQDVTAHSHEIAETFNDPFVGFDGIHNITPFWLNPAGQCQDLMEVGDVIEDLPNPTFPVTIDGFKYHPQTVALLPWFEFQSPSSAINGAYSYPGEGVLKSLSPPQPFNCNGL